MMRPHHAPATRHRPCLALALLAGAAAPALAQTTLTWNAAVNGDWSNPLRWTPNGIPNNSGPNTYNAVINLAGAYTVNLDIDATIQNFTHTANGGIFTLADNADLTVNQTMNLSAEFNGRRELGGLGTLRVNGDMVFGNGGRLRRTTNARVDGNILFNNSTTDEICDTGVDHRGALMAWNGSGNIIMGRAATITLSSATTFQINSAATLAWNNLGAFATIVNNGQVLKSSAGTTFFDRVILSNAPGGSVRVTSGILKVNQFTNASANTLTGGRYRVDDGGEFQVVDLADTTIELTTNNATVELFGAASRFDSLNTLTTNAAAGSLTVADGRSFTTAGNFSNLGTLAVGTAADLAPSNFTVAAGSSLGNYDAATHTLSGGAFALAHGTLRFDGASVQHLDTRLSLDGADANIVNGVGLTAFDGSLGISAAGDFTVRNRTFTTNGDLTNAGALHVGQGATVEVGAGGTLTNLAAGTLTGGTYDLAGTLKAGSGQAITTIAADVTLSGNAAGIRTAEDADALATWTRIATAGSFSLKGGATYTTAAPADFSVDGRLAVEAGSEFRVRAGSNLTNFAAGTLTGGTFDIQGTLRAQNASITRIASDITLDGPAGQILDLAGNNAFTPLNTVQSTGRFTVRDRTFTTSGSLALDGRLRVQSSGAARAPAEVVVSGDLHQTGTVELDGGTLTVLGNYDHGGSTEGSGTINADNLLLSGSFSAGAVNTLTVNAATTILDAAIVNLDLTDALLPAGAGADQFLFTGLTTFDGGLAGTLRVNDATFAGSVGQVFQDVIVFTGPAPAGFFARFDLFIDAQNLYLTPIFNGNSMSLVVTTIPAPASLTLLSLTLLAARRRR